jgi:hypothetical protein
VRQADVCFFVCGWLRKELLGLLCLQAETLVGVMSDRALEGLIASEGTFNMSSK